MMVEQTGEKKQSIEEELERCRQELSRIRKDEEKFRHFFEQSPVMIYVIDTEGSFINLNRAGVAMLAEDDVPSVVGRKFDEYFEIKREDFFRNQEILEKNGGIEKYDTQMKCRDGTTRQVQLSVAQRKTVSGKLRGYEGFVIDITSRKETERRLAESEIKYRTVLDNSLAAIYLFQDGGYFSYVNPRMLKVLGYSREDEIIGRGFWEVIAPEDRDVVRKRGLEREKREFSPRRYKFRMLRKDGSKIWVDMRASHASYLGSPAAVGNFIDITREVKAEEKVRLLTQRVIKGIEDERRSLANDIHDEFGQMLTSLQFDVERLKATLPDTYPDSRELCEKVMAQIQRLAEKVRDTTSRLRPDMLDHLGLVPTLQWYIKELEQEGSDLHFSFQAAGLKKRLSSDVELVLYRVFQESVNNILKHADATEVDVQLTYNYPDIIFVVKDNGNGFEIDDDGMPRYHTRKAIGLLSMKERVSSLDGTMRIISAPGKGTLLRIKIPINQKSLDEHN
jgi:PAS domain S-box-containing protein